MVAAPVAHTETLRRMTGPRAGGRGETVLYKSDDIAVSAQTSGSVHVTCRVDAEALAADEWRAIAHKANAPGVVQGAMEAAFVALFSRSFAREIDRVTDAYRVMLRESLATGIDPELQSALNRARLQEKILAGTTMVDQAQACELLGLSGANPSATMKRKEERREILRFTVDGRAAYPLFQFDIEGRRISAAMAQLIALKPAAWSDFRLLHWLTRPHLDFGAPPAERLGAEAADVLAAFKREIVLIEHG
jgi:hypothetical protein